MIKTRLDLVEVTLLFCFSALTFEVSQCLMCVYLCVLCSAAFTGSWMDPSPARRRFCLPPFRNWWRDTTNTLGHSLAVRWTKLLHLHKLLSCISGFLSSLKVLSSSTTAIKTNLNSAETLQAWVDAVHSCNACKLRTLFYCLSLLAVSSLCS